MNEKDFNLVLYVLQYVSENRLMSDETLEQVDALLAKYTGVLITEAE